MLVVVDVVFAIVVGMTPIASNTTENTIDSKIVVVVGGVVSVVVVVVFVALTVIKAFAEADRVESGDETTESPPWRQPYGRSGLASSGFGDV